MSQYINEISQRITNVVELFTKENEKMSNQTNMIAINASIEAARLGKNGASFAVVAEEIKKLADQAKLLSINLRRQTLQEIENLTASLQNEIYTAEQKRLSDMALTLIQLMVRNLFERTADVRWWATDDSFVTALMEPNPSHIESMRKRLQLIHKFYSIYFDLVVVNANGEVISGSCIDGFNYTQGTDLSALDWVKFALRTASSEDYVAEKITPSNIHNDKVTAVYATAIRKNGLMTEKAIGALGVYFNWEDQAKIITQEEPNFKDEEWNRSRVLLLDKDFRIIADSEEKDLFKTFPLKVGYANKGTYVDENSNFVAFAKTIGYQEYDGLGWYGVVIQKPAEI